MPTPALASDMNKERRRESNAEALLRAVVAVIQSVVSHAVIAFLVTR